PVFEKDKKNRRVVTRRSYNLYSDVQKGEKVVVEIPVQAGEKHSPADCLSVFPYQS
ncbi:DUF961 family protein, partial [Clostridioides difficile]|uniref:DUF961 family protein n=1 Tax=Clostridioides difficile TaxID=1496 RepID=UPI00115E1D03